jgi:hypothetical protein
LKLSPALANLRDMSRTSPTWLLSSVALLGLSTSACSDEARTVLAPLSPAPEAAPEAQAVPETAPEAEAAPQNPGTGAEPPASVGPGEGGASPATGEGSTDPGSSGPGTGEGTGAVAATPIVVVAQVYGLDDTYNTYVRVFPEVPTGEVELTQFREFGNANVSVNAGAIFVEEDSVVTRFTVDEQLQLVEGQRFSWVDFGVVGANATSTVFASATRAYTFTPGLGIVIAWDPEQMVRTNVIEFEYPARAAGMETWANDGRVVGNNIIWNVFSGSFDSYVAHPGLTLAILDTSGEGAVQFVEDPRCLPGGPSFIDENGDYYVHGAGYFGAFYALGPSTPARTCALRVKAGEAAFDPDYVFDYEGALGTPLTDPFIHITGSYYLANTWDPALPAPADVDAFWAATRRSMIVDMASGTAQAYPAFQGLSTIDGVTREVGGVSYFQGSTTGYVAGGEAAVYELRVDGASPRFTLKGGFLLGIEPLR